MQCKQKMIPCEKCGGSGKLIDQRALGSEMRDLREESGVSLREISRRLRLSAAYISDLERGRRDWADELIAKFKGAIKQ